jgi:hypothetical protein
MAALRSRALAEGQQAWSAAAPATYRTSVERREASGARAAAPLMLRASVAAVICAMPLRQTQVA